MNKNMNEYEQLSMDFSQSNPPDPIPTEESVQYEPLDTQLADLMQELNGGKDQTLKNCTLEISRHTREGQIAIPCSESQQSELFHSAVVGKAGDYKPLIIDDGYLYLNRYWNYQHQLAEQIKSRLSSVDDVSQLSEEKISWIKTHLDKYFKADNQNLATDETNWQQVAAALALIHKFLIVSGGPGTGKTTTITRILALLIEQHMLRPKSGHGSATVSDKKLRILLAAPTGKAAIRMLDAIGDAQQKLRGSDSCSGFVSEDVLEQMPNHASTIHKLLGYQPNSVQFKHNRSNPLNADVVLVDEASMIDIALMSKLVEAVPANAKLILIGDKDQLSSVETGSVFADICGENAAKNEYSEVIIDYLSKVMGDGSKTVSKDSNSSSYLHDHIVTLQKNWRFSEDSGISQLSIATNTADAEQALEILKSGNAKDKERNKNSPCKLILPEELNETDLISPWKHYFEVLNDPKSSIKEIFEAFNQYRVLCALRKGSNGSIGMSNRIETLIAKQGLINGRAFSNQSQKHVSGQKQNWYHGRPVMITQNSYSKGLYNGDTGITLMDENGQAKVWFPSDDGSVFTEGSFKSYAPVRLPAHETTWAMTIHKSQGSEFDEVIMILPHEVMPLLTRQLIYTGITRAKARVSVVASEGVFRAGVKTKAVSATNIGNKLSGFDALGEDNVISQEGENQRM